MKITTILHPLEAPLGEMVREMLKADFDHIVWAVAYAKVGAVARLLEDIRADGRHLDIFCSQDSGVTSAQAVQLLAGMGANVYLLGSAAQKYHPKFWFAWSSTSPAFQAIIGSGNLTVGGLWANIEASAKLEGDRRDSDDSPTFDKLVHYGDALKKRARGPVRGSDIQGLILDGALCDEATTPPRVARTGTEGPKKAPLPLLGTIIVPPVSSRAVALAGRQHTRPGRKRPTGRLTLAPRAFIMTLNKLKGVSIPGEIRIPVAALRAAEEFWEWPDSYVKDQTKTRTFYNRTPMPVWRISGGGEETVQQAARLYLYKESMDFRLYSTVIRDRVGQGDGDIVVISRSLAPGVDYEVDIILRTDVRYSDALSRCTQTVPNSRRRWAFVD